MSDRKERKRMIRWILLIAAGSALILFSGLRSVSENKTVYAASGRSPVIPETAMPNGSISVNEAETDELTELYGIGETLASLSVPVSGGSDGCKGNRNKKTGGFPRFHQSGLTVPCKIQKKPEDEKHAIPCAVPTVETQRLFPYGGTESDR